MSLIPPTPLAEPDDLPVVTAGQPVPPNMIPDLPATILIGWQELNDMRLGCIETQLKGLRAELAALPDAIAMAQVAALRAELGVAVGRAYLEGRRTACSLCIGEGCESPSCRRAARP